MLAIVIAVLLLLKS